MGQFAHDAANVTCSPAETVTEGGAPTSGAVAASGAVVTPLSGGSALPASALEGPASSTGAPSLPASLGEGTGAPSAPASEGAGAGAPVASGSRVPFACRRTNSENAGFSFGTCRFKY